MVGQQSPSKLNFLQKGAAEHDASTGLIVGRLPTGDGVGGRAPTGDGVGDVFFSLLKLFSLLLV